MNTEITASLVVNFRDPNETGPDGTAPDASLIVEVDSRADGLNGGRTTIRPGDSVGYLIYKTDNVTITEQIVTAGGISSAGAGLITIGGADDPLRLNFLDDDEQTVSKPIAGGLKTNWFGADGGNVAQASQLRLRTSSKVIGVLDVEYQTQFQGYRLSNVPSSVPQVIIFVRGVYG